MTTEAFGAHGSYVRVAGDLDLAYAAQLGEAIEGAISRGHRHLVIDLSAATFLDCASIGILLSAVSPLRNDPDAAIVLAGPTGIVKRLLDILHLDRLFDILPDVDHATATDRRHVDGWRRTNHEKLVAQPLQPATEKVPTASDDPNVAA